MTEQQKQDARERRRATDPRKTALTELKLVNPGAYVEARTLEYIKKMEALAAQAEAAGNPALAAQIYRYLASLTSLGRARLDVTAHLEKQEVPDLSALPPDQLLQLIEATKEMRGPITIELPERTAGNGHVGTEDAPL